MRMVSFSAVLIFVLLPGFPLAATTSPKNIGLNLAGIADHSSQWAFTNAFLASRPWTGEKIGIRGYYQHGLELDEDGWMKRLMPGETAFSLLFVDIERKYPKGEYLLLYDGDGQLQFKWNISIRRKGKGYVVVDVQPDDQGIEVRITEINPNNPIRNIRLFMPGYWDQHEVYPFHPYFLEKIKDFTIFRFMDWQETNNSNIRSWLQRPKITDATFAGGKGVPLEYLVLFCNIKKASPWFNIPHLAENEYVEKFAEYVRDHLHPSLDIYIEYSNEVWNTIFNQHRYAAYKGKEMGLSDNDFQAYARFYSQRAVEIYRIWKKVFHNSDRVKLVLAGQIGNNWLASQILEWKEAYKAASAYAIAPYFGGSFCDEERIKKVKEMSLPQLEVALVDDIMNISEIVERHSIFLKKYGLPLYGYEAGQHLVCGYGKENDVSINRLFDRANKDKSMKRLYALYLQLWKKKGGDLIMIFSSIARQSKWGRWGIMENMYAGREDSPKLDAILDFMESE